MRGASRPVTWLGWKEGVWEGHSLRGTNLYKGRGLKVTAGVLNSGVKPSCGGSWLLMTK